MRLHFELRIPTYATFFYFHSDVLHTYNDLTVNSEIFKDVKKVSIFITQKS